MEAHYATLFESIADAVPNRTALLQGDRRRTWAEFEARAARLAALLGAHGVGHRSKVAILQHNSIEYVETYFGVLKMRGIPAHINYHYREQELAYLLDYVDAEALVFAGPLAERVAAILPQLPKVRLLVQVGDDAAVVPGALDYDTALDGLDPAPRIVRSSDDEVMSCTGGTTGLPKAVVAPMNRQVPAGLALARSRYGLDLPEAVDAVPGVIARDTTARCGIPASPLMHGTGLVLFSLPLLASGGTLVLTESRSFRPAELLALTERHRVGSWGLVGDAFGRPIVEELAAARDRGEPYDVSAVQIVVSSGVALSRDVQLELFEWMPDLTITEACGSSEGGTFGTRTITRETVSAASTFDPAPGTMLIDAHGRRIDPASGERGLIAARTVADGYYKDPEKTAATFRTIDGERYVVTGDWGRFDATGALVLLGRGSDVINTGGEKVFPAEVEEVLTTHPAVTDAVVLGAPSERFGTEVRAVVAGDAAQIEDEELAAFVRERLAPYKTPRRVVVVSAIPRLPNGKLDRPKLDALLALDDASASHRAS